LDIFTKKIEPEIQNLLNELRQAGGRPLLVGGWVRDNLLGLTSHDVDIEVYGLEPDALKQALEKTGQVFAVGVSFGVLKVKVAPGNTVDVSLPRRESMQGPRGLLFTPDLNMTPQEAASRRDFTINAMAYDPAEGELLDFFGGQSDLKQGILRHVGPAFAEDPLRVLRGMQFAARWDLRMAPETIEFCTELRDRYDTLAGQRVWGEWQKLLVKGRKPSAGLTVLEQTGWRELYQVLDKLATVPLIGARKSGEQEARTAWQHTLAAMDLAVEISRRDKLEPLEREILLLASLCHEFGQVQQILSGRPSLEPGPHQVEIAADQTERFLQSIDCPHYLSNKVVPVVNEYMAHRLEGYKKPAAPKVRHLAVRLAPSGITQWERLVEICARSGGEQRRKRPALAWLKLARELGCAEQPVPPLLLGRHLLEAGLKPGKQFRALLDQAYAAQLDGTFETEEAAREWLRELLPPVPPEPTGPGEETQVENLHTGESVNQ
jgi:tRNA nucleotidyltransferase (CCA-adding enzyme)